MTGTVRPFSDVDVAIVPVAQPDPLDLGYLVNVLEEATGHSVDLLDATDLFTRRPKLAYQIVRDRVLLVDHDHEALVAFKKHTFLHYLDTEYLRRLTESALVERLKNGDLGRRGHAR